jgi:hypothetical protein
MFIAEYRGKIIWRNEVNGMYYSLGIGAADTIKGMRQLIKESI